MADFLYPLSVGRGQMWGGSKPWPLTILCCWFVETLVFRWGSPMCNSPSTTSLLPEVWRVPDERMSNFRTWRMYVRYWRIPNASWDWQGRQGRLLGDRKHWVDIRSGTSRPQTKNNRLSTTLVCSLPMEHTSQSERWYGSSWSSSSWSAPVRPKTSCCWWKNQSLCTTVQYFIPFVPLFIFFYCIICWIKFHL